MWTRNRKSAAADPAEDLPPTRLKEAIRNARVESAERTDVVVDLRDAALARLEILNEALEPLFEEISPDVELFDRGISRGDTPRLWIDVVAHVEMGRDRRLYRFLQDTRYGRKVLAESFDVKDLIQAVTKYVARRVVERERALAEDAVPLLGDARHEAKFQRRRSRWRALRAFLFGLALGIASLFAAAWFIAVR
jgi:hypothetical protein